jgi:hypothetical protein
MSFNGKIATFPAFGGVSAAGSVTGKSVAVAIAATANQCFMKTSVILLDTQNGETHRASGSHPYGILKVELIMLFQEANAKRPQIDAAVAETLAELSPDVVQIRYKIALDWSDEWAVYFHVLLSDEASKDTRELAPRIVHGFSDKLPLDTFGMFSYVHFRSQSEQAESAAPAWA